MKRDGADRHWAGSGKVLIEKSPVESYLALIGRLELDLTRFTVIEDLPEPNPDEFVAIENRRLER